MELLETQVIAADAILKVGKFLLLILTNLTRFCLLFVPYHARTFQGEHMFPKRSSLRWLGGDGSILCFRAERIAQVPVDAFVEKTNLRCQDCLPDAVATSPSVSA